MAIMEGKTGYTQIGFFWISFFYLWIKFCIWWLKMFVSRSSNSVKHQICILELNEVCFTQGAGGNVYHIGRLHACTSFNPKSKFLCFNMIELIETKILSYYMQNFIHKYSKNILICSKKFKNGPSHIRLGGYYLTKNVCLRVITPKTWYFLPEKKIQFGSDV